MKQEILPCPFCGGEAKVNKWEGGFKVLCQKAFCAVLGPFNSEAEATDAWNTRTERTCNLHDHVADVAWCSGCKEPMKYPDHPNYCPECGAMVVE